MQDIQAGIQTRYKVCINFSRSREKAEESQQEIEKFGGEARIRE